MKKFILLVIGAIILLLGVESKAEVSAEESPFGINPCVNLYWEEKDMWSPLDSVASLGTKWVRIGFFWDHIDTAENKPYNWNFIDEVVKECQNRGLQILGNMHRTPEWARTRPSHIDPAAWPDSHNYPPDNGNDWYDFVYAAVERYDYDGTSDMEGLKYPIKYWGMWNEPNLYIFYAYHPLLPDWPNVSVEDWAKDYANKILIKGYTAVRDADPTSTCKISAPETWWFTWMDANKVWGNGNDPPLYEWIDAVVDAINTSSDMTLEDIDIFSYHYYPEYPQGLLDQLDDWVRPYMISHGVSDKPLWQTETGWSTEQADPPPPNAPEYFSEEEQADGFIGICKGMLERPWFKKVFFYELWDTPWDNDADWGILKHPLDTIFHGWPEYLYNGGRIMWDSQITYSGNFSCKLSREVTDVPQPDGGYMKVCSKWVDCDQDVPYEAEAAIRTEGISGIASWDIYVKKTNGDIHVENGEHFSGINPFSKVTPITFTTESDADSLKVVLFLDPQTTGTAWYDAISLYPQANPTENMLDNYEASFEELKRRPGEILEPSEILSPKLAFDAYKNFIENYNLWLVSNDAEATAYNNQRKLAVDSDNNLHLVFSSSYNDIRYAKSVDDGNSWPSEYKHIVGEGKYPALALGGNNEINVCWIKPLIGAVKLYYYSESSGTQEISTSQLIEGTLWGFAPPSIAVDANNQVHLALQVFTASPPLWHKYEVWYGTFTAGSPGACQWELVKSRSCEEDIPEEWKELLKSPSIDIDQSQCPHIAFSLHQCDLAQPSEIYYANKLTGNWTSQFMDNGKHPFIDAQNTDINIVYEKDGDVYLASYPWSIPQNISGTGTSNPSRSPQILEGVVIVWSEKQSGGKYDICYKNWEPDWAGGYRWSGRKFLSNTDKDSKYPQIALEPTGSGCYYLNCVWTEGDEAPYEIKSKRKFFSTTGVDHQDEDLVMSSDTTISGIHWNINTFTINSGATINIVPWNNSDSTTGMLRIDAKVINISGTLSGNEAGYTSSEGPGAGMDSPVSNPAGAGGAGYGGAGGKGNNAEPGYSEGGPAYGNEESPSNPGSGGGNDYYGTGTVVYGGKGGGAIKLQAGFITLNGTITCSGGDGTKDGGFFSSHSSGGGSGGSAWLVCDSLSGSGTITAEGGNGGSPVLSGYAGGGAGGRISIRVNNLDFDTTHISVAGGAKGGGGAEDGEDGTIYLTDLSGGGTQGADGKPKPMVFAFSQNYPNPFVKKTTINYQIPAKSKVSLRIYDVAGRCVKTLIDGEKSIGYYKVDFDARELSTGIYFAKFKAEDYKETKKLILIR